MMTMSCLTASLMASHLDEHACRVLDGVFDALEERHSLAPVDDAVIVSEGDVHHRPDHYLTVDRDGTLLYGVHAEHARLRRVDDGGRHQRTEHATVADSERPALQLVGQDLVVAGPGAVVGDHALDLRERQALCVADDRHYQALLAGDGYTDVVVVLVHDVGAADLGVELRHQLERVYRSLDEERSEEHT